MITSARIYLPVVLSAVIFSEIILGQNKWAQTKNEYLRQVVSQFIEDWIQLYWTYKRGEIQCNNDHEFSNLSVVLPSNKHVHVLRIVPDRSHTLVRSKVSAHAISFTIVAWGTQLGCSKILCVCVCVCVYVCVCVEWMTKITQGRRKGREEERDRERKTERERERKWLHKLDGDEWRRRRRGGRKRERERERESEWLHKLDGDEWRRRRQGALGCSRSFDVPDVRVSRHPQRRLLEIQNRVPTTIVVQGAVPSDERASTRVQQELERIRS